MKFYNSHSSCNGDVTSFLQNLKKEKKKNGQDRFKDFFYVIASGGIYSRIRIIYFHRKYESLAQILLVHFR